MRWRRDGWRVNHKKVERIYREDGLSSRRLARKMAMAVPRETHHHRGGEFHVIVDNVLDDDGSLLEGSAGD